MSGDEPKGMCPHCCGWGPSGAFCDCSGARAARLGMVRKWLTRHGQGGPEGEVIECPVCFEPAFIVPDSTYMTRSWTRVPTWLYAWHMFVCLWLGACAGFLVGWLAR